MANTLTAFTDKILAQGLLALREQCVLPRLVNMDYGAEARQFGNTIDIPIPSAITVQAVTPGNTPPSTADVTTTSVQVALNKWYESPFYLTDKELLETTPSYVPRQVTEAVRSLANQINSDLFSLYTKIYGYVGTAGTTPFASDTSAATSARKVLNKQLAPVDQRRIVLDPDADANALGLRAFQDASFRGDTGGIGEGQIRRKLGFDFFMDQQVPTHTAGTAAGATTNNAGYAVGIKTVTLASAGTGTILVGDIITFAGDTQTYVVTAGDADVSNGGTVSFEPGLKVAIPTSNTAITVKASHVVNLAFHRDAFALAMRPLEDQQHPGLGSLIQSATDPVSGLSMRLEVRREHKRLRWSFDVLYGVAVVRPEFACRIAG